MAHGEIRPPTAREAPPASIRVIKGNMGRARERNLSSLKAGGCLSRAPPRHSLLVGVCPHPLVVYGLKHLIGRRLTVRRCGPLAGSKPRAGFLFNLLFRRTSPYRKCACGVRTACCVILHSLRPPACKSMRYSQTLRIWFNPVGRSEPKACLASLRRGGSDGDAEAQGLRSGGQPWRIAC